MRPIGLPRALAVMTVLAALVPASAGASGSSSAPAAPAPSGAPDCHPIAPLTARSALPVGAGACAGVRPGAFIETPIGFCTLNFLFTGSDRNRYIGTAGHCLIGEGPFPVDAGEKTWRYPRGPVIKDIEGKVIGHAVYAILQEPKDFALIRLLPSVQANAAMCHFGGPTSAQAPTRGPELLHYYGNGLAIGEVLPARTALAPNMSSPDEVVAEGLVIQGDSGGAVIDGDGRAVGVLVTTGVHAESFTEPGTIGITRLQPQIARAAKVLRLRFTLRTAPLA